MSTSGDFVLDASSIASYLLNELGSERVYQTMKASIEGGHRVLTPGLAYKEVSNALLKACTRRRLLTKEELDSTLDRLFKLPLESVRQEKELILRAVKISLQSEVTVYDALYIASAEQEKATLLTSDRKQHTQARNHVSTTLI